ncbi:hypothetical protein HK105_202247 [Polyrhizophydium stewartii]|uniref:PH domain-containing protein n=1 Tax=Polyrhizophydium stewartii TaxID=2732419 RepID=A0ABR4NFM5_9FUNG
MQTAEASSETAAAPGPLSQPPGRRTVRIVSPPTSPTDERAPPLVFSDGDDDDPGDDDADDDDGEPSAPDALAAATAAGPWAGARAASVAQAARAALAAQTPSALEHEQPLLSGYLLKKGEQRREYETLNIIMLAHITTVAAVALRRRPYALGIVTRARTFCVAADTQVERDRWLTAMRSALAAARSQMIAPPGSAVPLPTDPVPAISLSGGDAQARPQIRTQIPAPGTADPSASQPSPYPDSDAPSLKDSIATTESVLTIGSNPSFRTASLAPLDEAAETSSAIAAEDERSRSVHLPPRPSSFVQPALIAQAQQLTQSPAGSPLLMHAPPPPLDTPRSARNYAGVGSPAASYPPLGATSGHGLHSAAERAAVHDAASERDHAQPSRRRLSWADHVAAATITRSLARGLNLASSIARGGNGPMSPTEAAVSSPVAPRSASSSPDPAPFIPPRLSEPGGSRSPTRADMDAAHQPPSAPPLLSQPVHLQHNRHQIHQMSQPEFRPSLASSTQSSLQTPMSHTDFSASQSPVLVAEHPRSAGQPHQAHAQTQATTPTQSSFTPSFLHLQQHSPDYPFSDSDDDPETHASHSQTYAASHLTSQTLDMDHAHSYDRTHLTLDQRDQIRSAIQALANDQIICQGYLDRLTTGLPKQWKRRWFVLRNGNLTCYKNESEYEVKHILPLATVLDIFAVEPQGKNGAHANCFKLVLPKRSWILCAASAQDAQAWISALQYVHQRVAPTS